MNSVIIFDFEVFKYDTLFGAHILNDDNITTMQTWNLKEICTFYEEHINDVWVGHNISRYDNLILQAIVRGMNEEQLKEYSNKIIDMKYKPWLDIHLNYYDTMTAIPCSLKKTEALDGKNISETKVDFRLNRKLTDEEKSLIESYNRDDLNQTESNFFNTIGVFNLRLQLIQEFNLSLQALHMTEAQIAETVLHAHKTPGIENWVLHPFEYPQLKLKNQEIKDFFFSETFKKEKTLTVNLCGVPHTFGIGGLHGARNKVWYDWAYYFDVSGYYNLVMINYDLLPRSIEKEYEHLYPQMYKQQLEFKKTAPEKRGAYKVILLSVFGAMFNEHCKFYDPYKAALVTMTGQLFIADLLEKLEGKVELIQTNTDGIIAKPLPGIPEQEVIDIVNEWQERTGFVLKLEKIYNVRQRDVNCYCYSFTEKITDADNQIYVLGDLKHFFAKDYLYSWKLFSPKEPQIISVALVNYLMFGKKPEDTISENSHCLRLYQFICNKGTYDWLEYREKNIETGQTKIEKLQHINRAFPMKSNNTVGQIYKCKEEKQSIIPMLPKSVFVYNEDINSDEVYDKIKDKIDWQYYIDRTYERMKEFIPFVKEICL